MYGAYCRWLEERSTLKLLFFCFFLTKLSLYVKPDHLSKQSCAHTPTPGQKTPLGGKAIDCCMFLLIFFWAGAGRELCGVTALCPDTFQFTPPDLWVITVLSDDRCERWRISPSSLELKMQ